MARKNQLELAKRAIERYFSEAGKKVYDIQGLRTVLATNRTTWRLPQGLTAARFIEFLQTNSRLQEIRVKSESFTDVNRYAWEEPSPLEVGLSLRRRAYLSHATAVFLHGLTDEIPKTVYVNAEQSPKPTPAQDLTQEAVDRAFSHPQRTSRYVYQWGGVTFVLLSGKHTGRLEVSRLSGPNGELLDATKVERTLVDIAVRPAYAGGVYKVLEAYEAAREQVSVNTLVAILKKLDFVYPYHQAIGFLMERAGYEPERLAPLQKLGMHLDFYLMHGMKKQSYDSSWRLFFPEGM